MLVTLFRFNGNLILKYPSYEIPSGHEPLHIIPLENCPESFFIVTTLSVLFFDTRSLMTTKMPLKVLKVLSLPLEPTPNYPTNYISSFALDSEGNEESQGLYLASEAGDILYSDISFISTISIPVTFSVIGKHAGPVDRLLLFSASEMCISPTQLSSGLAPSSPTTSVQYLACFGGLCNGSIMLVLFAFVMY